MYVKMALVSFLLPVLMTLLMTLDTWPFSSELSSFTSSIRQLHRTNKEQARRIRPMTKSDREQSTKRCLPKQGVSIRIELKTLNSKLV